MDDEVNTVNIFTRTPPRRPSPPALPPRHPPRTPPTHPRATRVFYFESVISDAYMSEIWLPNEVNVRWGSIRTRAENGRSRPKPAWARGRDAAPGAGRAAEG
jgi:hypothetical protein